MPALGDDYLPGCSPGAQPSQNPRFPSRGPCQLDSRHAQHGRHAVLSPPGRRHHYVHTPPQISILMPHQPAGPACSPASSSGSWAQRSRILRMHSPSHAPPRSTQRQAIACPAPVKPVRTLRVTHDLAPRSLSDCARPAASPSGAAQPRKSIGRANLQLLAAAAQLWSLAHCSRRPASRTCPCDGQAHVPGQALAQAGPSMQQDR